MKEEPAHPSALTGTTVYITFILDDVVFVKASFAKSESANPFATAAPPAETVAPFSVKAVTLYVAAATEELELKFAATATSEHNEDGVWLATTGAGLTLIET